MIQMVIGGEGTKLWSTDLRHVLESVAQTLVSSPEVAARYCCARLIHYLADVKGLGSDALEQARDEVTRWGMVYRENHVEGGFEIVDDTLLEYMFEQLIERFGFIEKEHALSAAVALFVKQRELPAA